jgi:hypothetical protein
MQRDTAWSVAIGCHSRTIEAAARMLDDVDELALDRFAFLPD